MRPLDDRCLAMRCPDCGAEPSVPCRGMRKKSVRYAHYSRRQLQLEFERITKLAQVAALQGEKPMRRIREAIQAAVARG